MVRVKQIAGPYYSGPGASPLSGGVRPRSCVDSSASATSAISDAIYRQDVKKLKSLITDSLVACMDDDMNPAIVSAIYNTPSAVPLAARQKKLCEIISVLHKHGADLDATEFKFGKSPLHACLEHEYLVVFEHLLKLGASADVCRGRCESDHYSSSRASSTPLFLQCVSELKLEPVEILLRCGVDVNMTDSSGETALFALARTYADKDILPPKNKGKRAAAADDEEDEEASESESESDDYSEDDGYGMSKRLFRTVAARMTTTDPALQNAAEKMLVLLEKHGADPHRTNNSDRKAAKYYNRGYYADKISAERFGGKGKNYVPTPGELLRKKQKAEKKVAAQAFDAVRNGIKANDVDAVKAALSKVPRIDSYSYRLSRDIPFSSDNFVSEAITSAKDADSVKALITAVVSHGAKVHDHHMTEVYSKGHDMDGVVTWLYQRWLPRGGCTSMLVPAAERLDVAMLRALIIIDQSAIKTHNSHGRKDAYRALTLAAMLPENAGTNPQQRAAEFASLLIVIGAPKNIHAYPSHADLLKEAGKTDTLLYRILHGGLRMLKPAVEAYLAKLQAVKLADAMADWATNPAAVFIPELHGPPPKQVIVRKPQLEAPTVVAASVPVTGTCKPAVSAMQSTNITGITPSSVPAVPLVKPEVKPTAPLPARALVPSAPRPVLASVAVTIGSAQPCKVASITSWLTSKPAATLASPSRPAPAVLGNPTVAAVTDVEDIDSDATDDEDVVKHYRPQAAFYAR